MKQFSENEARTKFSTISKMLEEKEEDYVLITRKNKPSLKVTLYDEDNNKSNIFGCAKGRFAIPENFDDIDITSDFEMDLS